jgi:hypothetical protein
LGQFSALLNLGRPWTSPDFGPFGTECGEIMIFLKFIEFHENVLLVKADWHCPASNVVIANIPIIYCKGIIFIIVKLYIHNNSITTWSMA